VALVYINPKKCYSGETPIVTMLFYIRSHKCGSRIERLSSGLKPSGYADWSARLKAFARAGGEETMK